MHQVQKTALSHGKSVPRLTGFALVSKDWVLVI
jgi:hypothetical protein